MPKTHRYGWVPDLPDERDFLYKMAAPEALVALPKKVSLQDKCPPVLDQDGLGSCTANAVASAHQFDQVKENALEIIAPSRLYIYYNARNLSKIIPALLGDGDRGATLRDSVRAIAKYGICPEEMWPYDITKFKREPPKKCYDFGKKHQAIKYERLTQSLDQLKSCLSDGYPFVFGFTVYQSFESKEVSQTGIAQLPKPGEATLGGHAVMAVGYDDETNRFLIKNSWGSRWGMKGYFTFPYEYLTNSRLSGDFWTIRLVEVGSDKPHG